MQDSDCTALDEVKSSGQSKGEGLHSTSAESTQSAQHIDISGSARHNHAVKVLPVCGSATRELQEEMCHVRGDVPASRKMNACAVISRSEKGCCEAVCLELSMCRRKLPGASARGLRAAESALFSPAPALTLTSTLAGSGFVFPA